MYMVPNEACSCTCGLFSHHQDLHWTMLRETYIRMVSLELFFFFMIFFKQISSCKPILQFFSPGVQILLFLWPFCCSFALTDSQWQSCRLCMVMCIC
jgi:hypothetical protein